MKLRELRCNKLGCEGIIIQNDVTCLSKSLKPQHFQTFCCSDCDTTFTEKQILQMLKEKG